MMNFPIFDAIALPAPITIFKALLLVTSSLHFIAVEIFFGGVLIAMVLNRLGQRQSRFYIGEGDNLSAAAVMARRLPAVLTFVINFAIPPLLFTQVLYGRALYTSSVLIGAWWISVVGLLMLCYWLLYKFSARCSQGSSALWLGLLVWLCAAAVGKILSMNMTLMLRPEVWGGMYAASPGGILLPPHDPTLMPRWIFMVLGGLTGGGIWMLWLGGRPSLDRIVREYLSHLGTHLVIIGIPIQLLAGFWVWKAQPDFVQAAFLKSGSFATAWVLFVLFWVTLFTVTLSRSRRGLNPKANGRFAVLLGAVGFFFMTLTRDAIRDVTLAHNGFDLWGRAEQVQTNFYVLSLFLLLFVVGLCVVTWLVLRVVWRWDLITDKVIAPPPPTGVLVEMKHEEVKAKAPLGPHCRYVSMSRGTFLGATLATVGLVYAGGLSYILYRYLGKPGTPENPKADAGRVASKPTSITLKGAAAIPAQSMMSFEFNGRFSLLIHHADNSWVAMDGICTHQGCKVRYEAEQNRIFCPCHSGIFDAKTGAAISGPPKQPLTTYNVEVQGQDIIIKAERL